MAEMNQAADIFEAELGFEEVAAAALEVPVLPDPDLPPAVVEGTRAVIGTVPVTEVPLTKLPPPLRPPLTAP